MSQLSAHFALWEFCCRCGNCKAVPPAIDLLRGLEELRELVGSPIHITSGGRCPEHNAAIGGSPKSCHLTQFRGYTRRPLAADVFIAGLSVRQGFNAARSVPLFRDGGIGVYPPRGFVHVDVRGQKARWAQLEIGGPMVGIPGNMYGRFEP